ncbi:myb-related transcription factor, partner of profilin-like isoform X1 [Pectinophora gossypiella]|uniref:myb-related transcription factor, partner of profilin-like isoform X1 n=1 Tax=Pectinophora gossypiella TaxID=13191 RepID=UPI00214E0E60|nr:myb-related transcription factor, partner of profilin-like isoform X1 [Pectinophora gossypiella]XP_049880829.1 myb-related transcription factor, partner of profilin-like isoform X1 [Pectinophora gossypiella]
MTTIIIKKHIFTLLEKKTFLDILKRYSSVIENKDTDGASLRAKNEAWDIVTREYNASPHATNQVTNKQLRRLWMNLKQRQREAERQHRLATGGGPATSDAVVDPDVSEVAPALIVGIDDAVDSETIPVTADLAVQEVNMDSQPVSYLAPLAAPTRTTLTPPPPGVGPLLSLSISTPLPALPTATPPPPPLPPSTPPPRLPTPPLINPSNTATQTFQRHKSSILDKEYKDRQRRANEIHDLEVLLLRERIREAKAKADLAELQLQQQCSSGTSVLPTCSSYYFKN